MAFERTYDRRPGPAPPPPARGATFPPPPPPPAAAPRPQHLRSVAAALRRIDAAVIDKLETIEILYEDKPGAAERGKWPDFHYLLAGIGSDGNGEDIDALGGFRN